MFVFPPPSLCHECLCQVVLIDLFISYLEQQNVELPDNFSTELRTLLEGLLHRDVDKRLGCRGKGYFFLFLTISIHEGDVAL